VQTSAAVQLALSAITPEASSTSLQAAERACLDALQGRRPMIDAYLCVGEARMQTQQFSGASCAFHTAASVASTDPRRRGDAYAREGDALSAMAREAGGADQRGLLDNAGAAYTSSINADRTSPKLAERYLSRADILLRMGEDDAARADIQLASSLPGNAGTASAFVRLLELRMGRGESLRDASLRELARAAWRADQRSAATNSFYGQVLFFENNPGADQALRDAIRFAQPGDQRYLPEAHYYLSLLEARASNYQASAQDASDAGDGDFRYQRQECLMELVRGGAQVYARDRSHRNTSPEEARGMPAYRACNVGPSAEAQLLLGMYWLRHAMYRGADLAPNRQGPNYRPWAEALNNAGSAFRQGMAALGNERPSLESLRWDELPSEHVTLYDMLDYGAQLTTYFLTQCGSAAPIGAAGGLFEKYRIVRPASDSRRCLPPAGSEDS